jgi:Zn-dependent peptidase ImmA (M78 family)/DNA-binding XRE family transcriptional regulator
MAVVRVTAATLIWAREHRGLSVEAAAERIGIPPAELGEMENDRRLPTATVFRAMARAYRLPEATLVRSQPPASPGRLPDHRTFESARATLDFGLSVAISRARTHQTHLAELAEDDPSIITTVPPEYTPKNDPVSLGQRERARIGPVAEQQLDWQDAAEGFRHLRAIIEKEGVFVYIEEWPLDETRSRGFSLYEHPKLPAIVINQEEDSPEARLFTIVHEYAHILIRQPGISDQNPKNLTERWCNQFAASFLMPEEALRLALGHWPNAPLEWEADGLARFARRLNVSQQAMALRLEQLNLAHEGLYREIVKLQSQRKKTPKKPGKPSFLALKLNSLGLRYTDTVLSAQGRGALTEVEAARMLDLSPRLFGRMQERARKQRDNFSDVLSEAW